MRSSEVDILIIPGWTGSGPDHWQSRWERNLSTARRVEQANWDEPVKDEWVARIIAAVDRATRPVVLVAHSCGVAAVVHAAPQLAVRGVAGAYLVAPADLEGADTWPARHGGFNPMPMAPLPFPSVLVASSDDPHCSLERAAAFARAWGADFAPAGAAGHINTASGHGPWPEGLMRFGLFLSRLGGKATRKSGDGTGAASEVKS
jgi:predicted alpha/beta hydrolase family esterase